jgi:hypothetical protein
MPWTTAAATLVRTIFRNAIGRASIKFGRKRYAFTGG